MKTLRFYPDFVNVPNSDKAVYIEGDLLVLDEDEVIATFRANSGGFGNGCLKHGMYKIQYTQALADDGTRNSFKKEGKPWWASLTAMFKDDREALGLHADGGIRGSLGCLVVMERDIEFFGILASIIKDQREIILTVY